MALFGIGKKKTEVKEAKSEEQRASSQTYSSSSPLKDVLVRPRVTEKAANMGSDNVYTFDVRSDATKNDVKAAIKALYKVKPIKVNMVNLPAKRVTLRGRRGVGMTAGSRKAYVFLKKGEQISIT